MAQPSPYIPRTSFIPFTNIGYVPGQQLDVEFNNIRTTTDQIRANLSLIQRDDGALTNLGVDFSQLSPAVLATIRANQSGSAVLNPNILDAATFPGVTAGDQIANCVAALPAYGGICDARNLTAGGVIPSMTLARSGVTILGPIGAFSVTGTINIGDGLHTISGFRWIGVGGNLNNTAGSNFIWAGNNASPMFRLRGARDCEMGYFAISSSSSVPLHVAIQSETATGTQASHRTYSNIYITGAGAGGLTTGFRWCTGDAAGGSGGNNNNDLDYLDNVEVVNYTGSAFSIEHSQSKTHTFNNCAFNSGGFGQCGVDTTAGTGGSFRWYNGIGGGSNLTADFNIGAPTDFILIEGANTEGSKRFLQTVGSNNQLPLTIIGGRYSADGINADNHAILYRMQGPLNVIGVTFEGGTTLGQNPDVFVGAATKISANGVGNAFTWDQSSVTATSDPFVSDSGNYWTTSGNQIRNADASVHLQIPDKRALHSLTVSTLPTCNAAYAGNSHFVTDQATAVSYHGAVTGGGSTAQRVTCDGSAWYQD